jgi:hypothetical protein
LKKFLWLIPLIILSSCKDEEVPSFDDLSGPEQDEIRNRSQAKCTNVNGPIYEGFKRESAKAFTSSKFNRGKGFKYTMTRGTNTRIVDLQVWKRTSTALYFYVKEDNFGASRNYFLRFTRTLNEEMIDDLLEDHCEQNYITTTSSSNLRIKFEYDIPNAPDHDFYVDTYSVPFNRPAFFANYFLERTITKRDTSSRSSNQVGEAVKVTSKLEETTYKFDSDDAEDSGYFNQEFCDFTPTSDTDEWDVAGRFHFAKGQNEGFLLNDEGCSSAVPLDWDLSV